MAALPTRFSELLAALGAEHQRVQRQLRLHEQENKLLRAKLGNEPLRLPPAKGIHDVPCLVPQSPRAPGGARCHEFETEKHALPNNGASLVAESLPVISKGTRIVSIDDLMDGLVEIPEVKGIAIDNDGRKADSGTYDIAGLDNEQQLACQQLSTSSGRSARRPSSENVMEGRGSHRKSFTLHRISDRNSAGDVRSVRICDAGEVEGDDNFSIPNEFDDPDLQKANSRGQLQSGATRLPRYSAESRRYSTVSDLSRSEVSFYSSHLDPVDDTNTFGEHNSNARSMDIVGSARLSGSQSFPDMWPIWKNDKSNNLLTRRKSKRMHTIMSFERSTGNLLLHSGGILQNLVVRPNSTKRLMWDLLSILMVSYDVLFIPLAVFELNRHPFTDAMDWVTTSYWTCDLPCSFLTGFHSGGAIEMRPRLIARNYLMSWFFFDCAVVVVDWVFIIQELNQGQGIENTGLMRIGKASGRVNRMFRAIRLIRFLKLQRLMAEVLQLVKSQYVHTCCTIGLSVILIVIFNHYLACGWYYIGKVGQDRGTANWIDRSHLYSNAEIYKYSTALHWSLTQFTPASMEVRPYNQFERIYSICVLFFALVTFSSFLGSITNAMSQLRRLQSDHTNEQISLRRFFAENKVSAELGQRIYKFLKNTHFSHRTRMMKEDCPTLQLLSGTLRRELNTELYRPYVTKNPFFYHFTGVNPEGVADVYDQTIGERSFFSKDEIFTDSQELNKMFFLISGRGNYTRYNFVMDNGVESMKTIVELVQEGSWISEPALWLQWTTIGQLFAQTSCEILYLDAAKFVKVAQDWSGESMRFVRGYVKHFIAYMQREETWSTDLWMNMDELHRIVQRAQTDVGESGRSKMPRHLTGHGQSFRLSRSSGASAATSNGQSPVFGRFSLKQRDSLDTEVRFSVGQDREGTSHQQEASTSLGSVAE